MVEYYMVVTNVVDPIQIVLTGLMQQQAVSQQGAENHNQYNNESNPGFVYHFTNGKQNYFK
jgi:hypothetical protein